MMGSTPRSWSRPLRDDSGFLLRLMGDEGVVCWIYMLTADFTPVGYLADSMRGLREAGRAVAAEHGLTLETDAPNRFRAGVRAGSPEEERGIVGHMEEYTFTDGTADVARLRWHLELLLRGRTIRRSVPQGATIARVGESLVGREVAREELLALANDGHVMLVGPRKCGKRSLLAWLADEAPAGRTVLAVDMLNPSDPAWFAVTLARTVCDHPDLSAVALPGDYDRAPADPFKALAWARTLRAALVDTWASFVRDLLTAVSAVCSPLLVLDDYVEFLDAIYASPGFDAFLVMSGEVLGDPDAPWRTILSGSRIVHYWLERWGHAEGLASFRQYEMPPLGRDAAQLAFDERLRTHGIRPELGLSERALDLVGHEVPFFVRLFADTVAGAVHGRSVTAEDIDAVYHGDLVGLQGRAYFAEVRRTVRSLETQVGRQVGSRILFAVAEAGQLLDADLHARVAPDVDDATLREVLAILQEYYFLEHRDGQWGFQVPIMRDFLRRHPPA
jgi:hypothetical protein